MSRQEYRLGVLTPSSNTVLEPITSDLVAGLPGVSAHFSRFRVVEISDRPQSQSQFLLEPQLTASDLLVDAKVDSIVWSGTSASWLGFDRDVTLCSEIEKRSGIKAGSAVGALNTLMGLGQVKTIGLVTPYIDTIQEQIIANYATVGVTCIAEQHFGVTENFAFGLFTEVQVETAIREVAASGPDAVVVMCTNMRGARLAERVEADTDVTVMDSTSAAVWDGLHLAGYDPTQVQGWGRMFQWH